MGISHLLFTLFLVNLKVERISKTIDIKSLMEIARNDIVVILRECEDFEGRKNFLSIAITEIGLSPEKLRDLLTNPSFLVSAIPNLKGAKILKKREDGSFDMEVEIEATVLSIIRPKVRYTERIFPKDDFIFAVITSGKGKGGWRQWELIKTEKGTLAIFSTCEYIRVIPLAEEIFSSNPHFELGFVSSTPLVVLTSIKKYIEKTMLKEKQLEESENMRKDEIKQNEIK